MVDHEALFERFVEIHDDHAWDRLGEVFTDDYVEEEPQSGEVFRGLANARAIRSGYPGLAEGVHSDDIDRSTMHLAASDEQWVLTPLYTAARVDGSGTSGTAIARVTYPDGGRWWNVVIYELRGAGWPEPDTIGQPSSRRQTGERRTGSRRPARGDGVTAG